MNKIELDLTEFEKELKRTIVSSINAYDIKESVEEMIGDMFDGDNVTKIVEKEVENRVKEALKEDEIVKTMESCVRRGLKDFLKNRIYGMVDKKIQGKLSQKKIKVEIEDL